MRIGIDMDDTITDTWNYMLEDISKEFNIDKNKGALCLKYLQFLRIGV